jgi:hypothetical protein
MRSKTALEDHPSRCPVSFASIIARIMGLDATAKKAATSVSSQIFSPSDITKAVGENIVQIGDDLFNSGNIPLRTRGGRNANVPPVSQNSARDIDPRRSAMR